MLKDQLSEFKIFNHYKEIMSIIKGENIFPVTVEIDPTNCCNMACIWCNDQKKLPQVSLKIKVLLNLIKELKDLKVKSLVIKGGGEPLLYPHILDVFSLCKKLNFPIGLITNGSYLNEKNTKLVGQSCRWVRISIDAGSNKTYQEIHCPKNKGMDLDKLLANIVRLQKVKSANCTIGCNYVIHRKNFLELPHIITKLKKIGVSYVNIRPPVLFRDKLNSYEWDAIDAVISEVSKMENGKFKVLSKYKEHDRDNYYLKKEWTRCHATPLIGNVSADGEVYVCCALKGFKSFSFGNIYKNSFSEIWTSQKRQNTLNKIGGKICQKFCSDRLDRHNKVFEYFFGEKENCEFL